MQMRLATLAGATRVQRVGRRHVLARLGVRHDREIGQPRQLRDQILLAAGHRGEARRGTLRPGAAVRHGDLVIGDEPLEHRPHRVRAIVALLLGRRHHLLDHRAGQAFAGQRRHVARIDPHVQRGDMGVPHARDHQRRLQCGPARRGAGQRQQDLADFHVGALSVTKRKLS